MIAGNHKYIQHYFCLQKRKAKKYHDRKPYAIVIWNHIVTEIIKVRYIIVKHTLNSKNVPFLTIKDAHYISKTCECH